MIMSRPVPVSLRMTRAGHGEEVVKIREILPSDFNEHDWSEIEDLMTMDSDFMESQDN